MYREILNQLDEWREKEQDERKVLLFAGSKGVGKTFTLKDFGAGYFTNTCSFDFKAQDYVRYLFEGELDKNFILKKLSVSCGETLIPGETLLVFENVDVLEHSRDIVDFICQQLKEFHVVFTLDRLEMNFLKNNPEIADKVNVINIYPLSFSEFLIVNKENSFCERISNQAKQPLDEEEKKKLESYLKVYMITGGMPSVVKTYVDTMSMGKVEAEKAKILFAMEEEIEAIEQPALRNKVKQVFDSIPMQLEKENKKFQYGVVKLTARAREYKDAVDWLIDHKFVVPIYRAKEAIAPLDGQIDDKSFELFVSDVGLLASMYGITFADIDEEEFPFHIKGDALLEQYIYSELLHNPNTNNIYYWISEATARIAFIFQDGDVVIPMEINLDSNEKAQSLKVFRGKYNVPMAVRISKDKMQMTQDTLTLPLFSIWNL